MLIKYFVLFIINLFLFSSISFAGDTDEDNVIAFVTFSQKQQCNLASQHLLPLRDKDTIKYYYISGIANLYGICRKQNHNLARSDFKNCVKDSFACREELLNTYISEVDTKKNIDFILSCADRGSIFAVILAGDYFFKKKDYKQVIFWNEVMRYSYILENDEKMIELSKDFHVDIYRKFSKKLIKDINKTAIQWYNEHITNENKYNDHNYTISNIKYYFLIPEWIEKTYTPLSRKNIPPKKDASEYEKLIDELLM